MLVHDLQPILAYTTDEVMAYLPESLREGQRYAALLDWFEAPLDRAGYERYLGAYEAMLEARNAFTKAYDKALEAGTIEEKTTQAARAELTVPHDAFEALSAAHLPILTAGTGEGSLERAFIELLEGGEGRDTA